VENQNKYVQSNRFPVSSSQQFAFKPAHKSTSKDIPNFSGQGDAAGESVKFRGGKSFFFSPPRHFIERIIDCSKNAGKALKDSTLGNFKNLTQGDVDELSDVKCGSLRSI